MDASAPSAAPVPIRQLPSTCKSASVPLPSDENDAKGLRQLQARIRGTISRSCLISSEAAIELHLEALQASDEVPESQGPRASALPTHEQQFKTARDMEKIVGVRAERRDYLVEVQSKQSLISRRIATLVAERYYLTPEKQRSVDRELRLLEEQEAEVVREVTLVQTFSSTKPVDAAKSSSRESASTPRSSAAETVPVIPFLRQCTTRRMNAERSVESLSPLIDADAVQARTQQVRIAKHTPQGYEAAIRTALLQTEMWNLGAAGAVRATKTLRRDMERIELQLRLTARAIRRLERVHRLRLLPEEKKRLALLKRYEAMLDASLAVMSREAAEVRKIGLKLAVRTRRRRLAACRELERAIVIQSVVRGHLARQVVQQAAAKAQYEADAARSAAALEEERHRQKKLLAAARWANLSMSTNKIVSTSRRAQAATMIQRLVRERKWNEEQVRLAERAFDRNAQHDATMQQVLYALRLPTQRTRLLHREAEHQKELHHSAGNKPSSPPQAWRPRVIETPEEVMLRAQVIAEHAHRYAFAAQEHAAASTAMTARPAHNRGCAVEVVPLAAATARPSRPATATRARPVRPRSRPASAASAPARTAPSLPYEPSPPFAPQQPQPPPMHTPARGRVTQSPRRPPAAEAADAASALALRRRTWIETPGTRALVEEATAEALQPALERMALQLNQSKTTTTAALLRARRACLEAPSNFPQREVLSKEDVTSNILINPRMEADHLKSANAKQARAWLDSSLPAARRKLDNAALAKWRGQRHAWMRSAGLRRRLLLEEERRTNALVRKQEKELESLERRMQRWQEEDDAVLKLQSVWRAALKRRRQSRRPVVKGGLKVRGIRRLPPSAPAAAPAAPPAAKKKHAPPNAPTRKPLSPRPRVDTNYANVTLHEVHEEETAESMVDPSRDLSTVCEGIEMLLDKALSRFGHEGIRQQTLVVTRQPPSYRRPEVM